MKINPHVFREYDVRGTVDRDLSPEFARLLGRAYAQMAREAGKDNIAVGQDCRHSSRAYADAFAAGLADEGLNAIMTGMGPTPQLYFAIYAREYGGGVQITGSHNPPDMNGFKMCLGTHTLSGEAIQDLCRRVMTLQSAPPAAAKRGTIGKQDIQQEYIHYLTEAARPFMGPRKLKIVVDAGNGVGGMVGPAVLKSLGCEVIELFCDPDGSFPNHHPDPTVIEYIQDLIAKVKETGADFGIGWDGDADRIGVVDEKGQVIFGDMLMLIYARQILKEVPGATIIADVKCSSRLFDDIEKRGGKAIMYKTGHSLIKNKLRETGGQLAGEMSGHICFKHRFFGFDDALHSACRFAEIVSSTSGPVSSLLSDLPAMVATPEIRLDCPEEIKFKIAEAAKSAFAEFEVNTIDGVRVRFDHGWALVRASNTQPVLVMRFEATSAENLEKYRKLVVDRIEDIKRKL